MKHTLITLALLLSVGCSTQKLYFDTNGFSHGTGWKEYQYKSGGLMLKEYYEDGCLTHSLWYKPDGTMIREEDWQDGAGTGIYLRENGTIKVFMPYVNGVAHGMAVYYKEDGSLDKVVEFHRGQKRE